MPSIKMFGPGVLSIKLVLDSVTGQVTSSDAPGFEVEASVLGEALRAFEVHVKCRFYPYQNEFAELQLGPNEVGKYFIFEDHRGSILVDVHVERNGKSICAKQDLMFALEPEDIVHIGPLGC